MEGLHTAHNKCKRPLKRAAVHRTMDDLNEGLKELEALNMDELKVLLTYETWADGLDLNKVEQYYKDLEDWSQEIIINYLKDVFNYS